MCRQCVKVCRKCIQGGMGGAQSIDDLASGLHNGAVDKKCVKIMQDGGRHTSSPLAWAIRTFPEFLSAAISSWPSFWFSTLRSFSDELLRSVSTTPDVTNSPAGLRSREGASGDHTAPDSHMLSMV